MEVLSRASHFLDPRLPFNERAYRTYCQAFGLDPKQSHQPFQLEAQKAEGIGKRVVVTLTKLVIHPLNL